MENQPEQLICIQEIKPDLKSQEFDSEFVSLDINELQSSVQGKIGANTTANNMAQSSLSSIEQQLKLKEIQLQQMEQMLKEKFGNAEFTTSKAGEMSTNQLSIQVKGEPNWPHPDWAYLFHDIEAEIPEDKRDLMYSSYRTWKLSVLGYIFNLITIGLAAFHDQYYESGFAKSQAMFTSLIWVIVAVPVSFLLWYMNLYRISKKFSTKNWLVYQFTFGCHILFSLIILSGCPWYPCAGIFFTLTCLLSGSIVSTMLGAMNCMIWFIILVLSFSTFTAAKRMFSGNNTKMSNTLAKIVEFAV